MKVIFVLQVLLCSYVSAETILIDRGLPSSTNVNNLSAPARSNVSWGNSFGFLNGDSFVTGDWTLDGLSLWIVGLPGAFDNMTLFGGVRGTYGNMLPVLSTFYVFQEDYYQQPKPPDPCSVSGVGVRYQDSGLGCLPITRITFRIAPMSVSAGSVFDFAIDAMPRVPSSCSLSSGSFGGCLFIHATNAPLAGTAQTGSDDLYRQFDGLGVLNPTDIDSRLNGWDKSSDINIVVTGTVSGATSSSGPATPTPEPSTLMLIVVGLALTAFRYKT